MSSVDGKCSIFVYNKERPPAKCGRQIGENMVCMKHLEKDVGKLTLCRCCLLKAGTPCRRWSLPSMYRSIFRLSYHILRCVM